MDIDKTFTGFGITFEYPGHLEVTTEQLDGTTTITVGEDGAFWLITIIDEVRDPGEVLEEVASTFQQEYDDVDEEHSATLFMGEAAGSVTLEFMSFELVSCVQMLATNRNQQTFFVMSQVAEHEQDQFEAQFQRISASVRLIDDHSSNKLS